MPPVLCLRSDVCHTSNLRQVVLTSLALIDPGYRTRLSGGGHTRCCTGRPM